ncbi:hypothetical protein Micbo1qcDRAFT_221032 [Microdochium bolleyi]|uniref:DUF7605 domain-containing protein n=1 Tax=Microdochium bolleyi TaxID=196109 RepID=A0A136JBH3_9PEZI|nr:hypothetical protein Micbo1qcDRAFT_221032 [Microdochium bolleyi]
MEHSPSTTVQPQCNSAAGDTQPIPSDDSVMVDVVCPTPDDTPQGLQQAIIEPSEDTNIMEENGLPSQGIKQESVPPESPTQESSTNTDEAPQSLAALQALRDSSSTETLQAAVCVSRSILQVVLRALKPAKESQYVNDKLQKSTQILKTQSVPEYIVGVVGGTGNGKSSLINSLLGESKLIPTNCARACTAVVTEISWNYSEAEEERYTATIEYISAKKWRAELDLLRADLCGNDENGDPVAVSRTPEAAIAWAKIREVYPYMTKEIFLSCTTDTLMADPDVHVLLGLTKAISASNVEDFCADISRFIDSREKSQPVDKTVSVAAADNEREVLNGADQDDDLSCDSDGEFQEDTDENSDSDDSDHWKPKRKESSTRVEAPKRKKKMALWPLIKVVRVRTKADILSSGLVLVDLVVASIHRAVDDKVAQNLLGSRFRQQVKLDGTYGNITLICSKTDDIMAEHAWEQFGLEKEYSRWKRSHRSKEQWEAAHGARLEDTQSRVRHLLSLEMEIDVRLAKWIGLLSSLEDGKRVKMPTEPIRKRKAVDGGARSSKKHSPRKKASDITLDSGTAGDDSGYAEANDVWQRLDRGPSMPLTGDTLNDIQVQSMLQHLKAVAMEASKEKHEAETTAFDYERQLAEINEKSDSRYARLRSRCIEKRNNFVKKEARRQFEMGLRDSPWLVFLLIQYRLDQFEAEKENLEDFDPTIEGQDYERLAADLPVFCVSIRDYELSKDIASSEGVSGGSAAQELSEVPQLAAHAMGLTRQGQIQRGRQFLNDVFEILNSLQIWAENQAWLVGEERERRVESLSAELSVLDTIERYLEKSSEDAIRAADMWPRKEGNQDGLPWCSYKAICRRSGAFKNAKGFHDFNEDLVAPLKRRLTRNWDKMFGGDIPKALTKFLKSTTESQQSFHDRMREEIEPGVTPSTLRALDSQLSARTKQSDFKAKALTDSATELRKETNRHFTPAIKLAMEDTYDSIMEENGAGSFVRMQKIMADHVEEKTMAMLREAVESVSVEFDKLFCKLEASIKDYANETFKAVKQDYTNVLGDATHGTIEEIVAIAAAKESIAQVLLGVERKYAEVLPQAEAATH